MILRYAKARYKMYQQELAYRFYITDSIYYYTNENKCLGVKYSDLLNPKAKDKRSGNEIALDVINRLGLEFN